MTGPFIQIIFFFQFWNGQSHLLVISNLFGKWLDVGSNVLFVWWMNWKWFECEMDGSWLMVEIGLEWLCEMDLKLNGGSMMLTKCFFENGTWCCPNSFVVLKGWFYSLFLFIYLVHIN